MTSARSTYLVDSNILLYAYDASEAQKRDRAIELLQQLTESGSGVLTVQVLGEFYVNAIRKIRPPMLPEAAAERVAHYSFVWPVLDLTASVLNEAIRCAMRYRLSYWDALVWAVAKVNDIPVILSEDIQSSGAIEGVRIINPLLPTFDRATLA
jgi:predicted nucleic acid-binding protein